MMKLRLNVLTLTALSLILSACQITGTGRFPGAVLRQATDDPVELLSGTLADDQTIAIAVEVPAALATISGRPAALYLETTDNVDLYVHNNAGNAVAYSGSEDVFTPPPPTASAVQHLSPQAVGTLASCLGPCVIRTAQATTYYVLLKNTTGGPISYSFFAYTNPFVDLAELGNDTRDGRVTFVSIEAGAIETLGDEDWFRADRSGVLTFTVPSGTPLSIRAELFHAGESTSYATLSGGQSRSVSAGDVIRVYEKDGWAGPADASAYNLSIP